MNQQSYILEVAIFTVKEQFVGNMPELRAGLSEALKSFVGLLELNAYGPAQDDRVFADLAKWDSLDSALAAAKAFENGDERFLPYMEAIEDLKYMGHFAPEIA